MRKNKIHTELRGKVGNQTFDEEKKKLKGNGPKW
jgi:hypothetical protein